MTATNLYDKYVDRIEAKVAVLPYTENLPNFKPSKTRKERSSQAAVTVKSQSTQTEQVTITDLPTDFDSMNTSAKSRYLVFVKDMSVAETARYLNIRYQQVYQVVKKEEIKQQAASK